MEDLLPMGWIRSSLDQFTQQRGRSLNPAKFPDEEFELYSIPSHETGKPEHVPGASIGSAKQVVRPNSVLLSKINPRINRVWKVGGLNQRRQIASTEWIVFPESEQIQADYLRYYLMQNSVRDFLAQNVSGVGGSLMRVKASTLHGFPILLAPLPEQHRIVEKIEILFAQLDAGEAALRQAQEQLARYRQSVLKDAVTGALTADWRAQNAHRLEHSRDLLDRILRTRRENWEGRGKYKEPAAPDTGDLPELPEGWVWASIDQVLDIFKNGLSKKPSLGSNDFPILRISSVRAMSVSLDDLRYYPALSHNEVEGFWVENGDLLFTRYSGSIAYVGVCGMMRGDCKVLHPDKLIKARIVSGIEFDREYAEIAWNAGESRSHIMENIKTTSGQKGIAGADIKAAPFPLPSFEEQQEIVSQVHLALSQIEMAQSACESELARSAALRQSILKEAFSGKLVPQDPRDEPADVLLARIRAERAQKKASAASKKQSSRKPAKSRA